MMKARCIVFVLIFIGVYSKPLNSVGAIVIPNIQSKEECNRIRNTYFYQNVCRCLPNHIAAFKPNNAVIACLFSVGENKDNQNVPEGSTDDSFSLWQILAISLSVLFLIVMVLSFVTFKWYKRKEKATKRTQPTITIDGTNLNELAPGVSINSDIRLQTRSLPGSPINHNTYPQMRSLPGSPLSNNNIHLQIRRMHGSPVSFSSMPSTPVNTPGCRTSLNNYVDTNSLGIPAGNDRNRQVHTATRQEEEDQTITLDELQVICAEINRNTSKNSNTEVSASYEDRNLSRITRTATS
ncbi:uncharacterized protein LOC130649373 [Hydractinia symbiolongicarpus]|uniref:uncharacterized protein LOC130649373 n=1 Tax=Hydractinia symbiolongicarpus TaxID=13093 RepID=UPI002551ACC7|nr:uncharacterized protein LOC130649373 [Hydractinia symbiolongicarpus]